MRFNISRSDPEPVYIQIKNQLKESIVSGKLKSGVMLPSVKELAEQADVSLMTAFRGIDELVREGLCYRRPKKGTYVSDGIKTSFRSHPLLGIYHSRLLKSLDSDIVRSQLYKGITELAHDRGAETVLISKEISSDNIEFYRRIDAFNLCGMVIFHDNMLASVLQLAEKHPDLRFVFLNYVYTGFEDTPANVYGVFNDDFAGAYQMGEYMLQKGHRRFGIISLDLSEENYRLREAGFKAAFDEYGIPGEAVTIMLPERKKKGSLREAGHAMAAELLALSPSPSALLCVNDLLAEGAAACLREYDRPQIEVAGYDNVLPHISRSLNFSTISIDFVSMGRKAVDILLYRKRTYPKVVKIIPQIICRNFGEATAGKSVKKRKRK